MQFAQADFDEAKKSFIADGRSLEGIEDAPYRFMAGPVSGLLASAALSQMERHDSAAKRFERSAGRFKRAEDELAKQKKALADCLKGGSARALQAAAAKRPCSDAAWTRLIARARALQPQPLAPRARKIAAELKAGRDARANRDLRLLKASFAGERARFDAVWKAVTACR